MYSKVIVPLDGSDLAEQALPYAELVAGSLSAPVELVQAYDILTPGLLGVRGHQVIAQLDGGARQKAEESLGPVVRRLHPRILELTWWLSAGRRQILSSLRRVRTRRRWW